MKPNRVADKFINVPAIKKYADEHKITFHKALHEILGIVVDEIQKAEYSDLIYGNVVKYIGTQDSITVDQLQQIFYIGYARAMRLIDKLIQDGYVREDSSKYYPCQDRYKS